MPPPTQHHILVVADNEAMHADLIQDPLSAEQRNSAEHGTHPVRRCSHGGFRTGRFDMILMGSLIPVTEGYSAMPAIRKSEATRDRRTRMIALTAQAMENNRCAG